ncbi:hypothetical protein Tco_0238071 [Tanacetum coccineum]
MTNLTSEDRIYDEAGTSYDSNTPSELNCEATESWVSLVDYVNKSSWPSMYAIGRFTHPSFPLEQWSAHLNYISHLKVECLRTVREIERKLELLQVYAWYSGLGCSKTYDGDSFTAHEFCGKSCIVVYWTLLNVSHSWVKFLRSKDETPEFCTNFLSKYRSVRETPQQKALLKDIIVHWCKLARTLIDILEAPIVMGRSCR